MHWVGLMELRVPPPSVGGEDGANAVGALVLVYIEALVYVRSEPWSLPSSKSGRGAGLVKSGREGASSG